MRRIFALLFFLIATEARADDTHYHDYPIGGRAVGLGGAFVALSDDPSGLYYNPAGIVDSPHNSLQVSTNLYGIEIAVSGDVLSSLASTIIDFDRVFAELQIIPTTAGFVQGIGRRRADGQYDHVIGLGAFVPSFRSVTVQTSGTTEGGERLTYRRDVLDRTIQACAGYGMRWNERLRFGVTGAATYRTLADEEETSIDAGVPPAGSRFNTASTNLDLAAASLLLTFGAKLTLSDDWRLGLALSTPSLQVYSTARLRVLRSAASPGGAEPSFELIEPRGLRSENQTPASLRFGFAHENKGGLFSGDVVVHLPVRYRLLVFPENTTVNVDRLTITPEVERRWIVNLNAGFETQINQDLSVSFGAWTDFSSAPPIEGAVGAELDRDRLPDIDAFGGSMVVGFHGEHTLTRAGFTFTYGSGADVIAQHQELRPLGGGGDLRKIELQQLLVFFFVSSTFMY